MVELAALRSPTRQGLDCLLAVFKHRLHLAHSLAEDGAFIMGGINLKAQEGDSPLK